MKTIKLFLLIGMLTMFASVKAQYDKVLQEPGTIYDDPSPEKADTNKVWTEIEQMPQFPGGDTELFKYINNKLKYPIKGHALGIQGNVIVRFIVDVDGTIIKPEIIKSLNPDFDAEVLRVIKLLPKFIPGKQNGKFVRVWYTVPVTFKLE